MESWRLSFLHDLPSPGLGEAIESGDPRKVMEVLGKVGEFVNPSARVYTTRFHSGVTLPLFLAFETDSKAIAKLLIERGADVDGTIDGLNGLQGNNMSILHMNCLNFHRFDEIKLLLKRRANVNAEDRYGWTPLHWTAFLGHQKLAALLIKYVRTFLGLAQFAWFDKAHYNWWKGANINAPDAEGETPLDKAARGRHKEVEEFLQSKGGVRTLPPESSLPSALTLDGLKLVLVGEADVGKTSLLHRFLFNKCPPQDVLSAENYCAATTVRRLGPFTLGQCTFTNVSVVDLAGEARYHRISPLYYQGAGIVIVVFDMSRRDTFLKARDWLTELRAAMPPHTLLILAGNKVDLRSPRTMRVEEARDYARAHSLVYIETSAVRSVNVQELFAYAFKIYFHTVGRYSKAGAVRPQQRKDGKRRGIGGIVRFEDLRTGRHRGYKHDRSAAVVAHAAERVGWVQRLDPGGYWRRRWLAVKDQYLYEYTDPADPAPRHVVRLKECTAEPPKDPLAAPYAFEVRLVRTTAASAAASMTSSLAGMVVEIHVFAVESRGEQRDWLAALDRARVKAAEARQKFAHLPLVAKRRSLLVAQCPIPDELYHGIRMAIGVEHAMLCLQSVGFAPALKYPLRGEHLKVSRHLEDGSLYVVDTDNFRLRLSEVQPSAAELWDYLKKTLPPATLYAPAGPRDFFENFSCAYLFACDRLEIAVQPQVLADLSQPGLAAAAGEASAVFRAVNLNNVAMTSLDVEALVYGLTFYPPCTGLYLRNSGLNDLCLTILADELVGPSAGLRWLRALDVAHNRFTPAHAGATLAGVLAKNTTLTSLDVSGNGLGAANVRKLFEPLSTGANTTLVQLDVSSNAIDDSIAKGLCMLLEKNSTLRTLQLLDNKLGPPTGYAVMSALTKNKTLWCCGVAGNSLLETQKNIIAGHGQLLRRSLSTQDLSAPPSPAVGHPAAAASFSQVATLYRPSAALLSTPTATAHRRSHSTALPSLRQSQTLYRHGDIAGLEAALGPGTMLLLRAGSHTDPLHVLPYEVLHRLFALLDVRSLCRCARVSKRWRAFVDSDAVWREKYLEQFPPEPGTPPSDPAVGSERALSVDDPSELTPIAPKPAISAVHEQPSPAAASPKRRCSWKTRYKRKVLAKGSASSLPDS